MKRWSWIAGSVVMLGSVMCSSSDPGTPDAGDAAVSCEANASAVYPALDGANCNVTDCRSLFVTRPFGCNQQNGLSLLGTELHQS